MKRIAVFSDIHGNYQALDAILNKINDNNYDEIIFLGDAIGIGPSPYECLNRLLESDITFIYGNHEMYSINGCVSFKNIKPDSRPHHLWTDDKIKELKEKLMNKMIYEKTISNVKFFHYQKDENNIILRPNDFPTVDYLDETFENVKEDYIIYGHSHITNYIKGKKNYFCLGSSGCVKDNHTFYTEVLIGDKIEINKIDVDYDRDKFIETFNNTDYPMKEFMGNVFFNIKEKSVRTNLIAHRGIHDKYIPENSLGAFKKALYYNIPIELDVHILKDNTVVVIHDDNLKRLTGVDKKLCECTYEEIKDLRLKNTDEKIPSLKDILKFIDGKVLLDIELKTDVKGYKLENELIKILKNYNGEFILKSFSYKTVKYLKKHTNYKVGLLLSSFNGYKKSIINRINFNVILKPDFLACNKKILDYKCVKTFKKDIYIWTIKSDEEITLYKADYYICENIF